VTARELLFPLNQPKHEERVIVYKLGDICPICEAGNLTNKEIVATFDYKGESVEIPNYLIWECSECKEKIVDPKTSKSAGRLIRDFYRHVDGLLIASEIRRIRKFKLELTQDEASELLGGGTKSFAKYENCEVMQSVALDNLLRLLDAAPYMLKVIKDKNKPRTEIVLEIAGTFGSSSQGRMIANYGK
jgi:HTH-type transcriptional regulator / antitoxin MqsA